MSTEDAAGQDWMSVAAKIPPPRGHRVDTSTSSPARMYDYYLDGKDNFAADRHAAERIMERWPAVREAARANRRFLVRAVRFLAERGIDQFVDLGCGLPTSPNVHEIAQQVHPGARVVYVDNDPIVTTHTRAIRAAYPDVIAIEADITDPGLPDNPALTGHLDLGRPVAILAFAVLHFVDVEPGRATVERWRDASVAGSALALSTATTPSQGRDEDVDDALQVYENSSANAGIVLRTPEQVAELFTGYDAVEPGIVQTEQWRSDDRPTDILGLAGVGIRR